MFGKILVFIYFFSVTTLYSQYKDFNFIVSVNNSLRDAYADKFMVTKKDGSTNTIDINYVQGKLSIKEGDIKVLTSEDVIDIELIVRHIKSCNKNTEHINYDLEGFKLPWLTNGTYFTLYIYDTSDKNYKKFYDPLPGKTFTFEYDWSEGSMRRVQKRLTKKQKKCNM